MNNKSISCCFTGHRSIEKDKISFINAALESEMEKMILNGIRFFYCGGAIGFDTLAEKAVIKLRKKYPDIKLLIAVPHKGQSNFFGEKERQEYNEILSLADEVIYLSESYYKGCMHARNRFMVDNSGHCICYLHKDTGGTAYTVRYAKKQGLHIINIADCFNQKKENEMEQKTGKICLAELRIMVVLWEHGELPASQIYRILQDKIG